MHFIRARELVFAVTAVSVLVFACSSKDDDWSYDGPRSSCSTGAPYDLGTHFPELNAPDAMDAPECVPRCGEKGGVFFNFGTTWPVAALPSGACSYDGEVCSMTAVHTRECPDRTMVACSLTPYACRCENGTWRCYAGLRGASACLCAGPRSGRDAGASDGAADTDASDEGTHGGDAGQQ